MKYTIWLGLLITGWSAHTQSLEVMPGTERIFMDVQWLETFDGAKKWSLFSRTRATVDDRERTDLFTGAYLNYTTSSGFGGTVVGRIGGAAAGGDAGLHYFKAARAFMVYALASIAMDREFGTSWFSIMRYTPELREGLKIYSSLELFTNLNRQGHAFSVQRLRVGLEIPFIQFGLACNLSGAGVDYDTAVNPGIFVRKNF